MWRNQIQNKSNSKSDCEYYNNDRYGCGQMYRTPIKQQETIQNNVCCSPYQFDFNFYFGNLMSSGHLPIPHFEHLSSAQPKKESNLFPASNQNGEKSAFKITPPSDWAIDKKNIFNHNRMVNVNNENDCNNSNECNHSCNAHGLTEGQYNGGDQNGIDFTGLGINDANFCGNCHLITKRNLSQVFDNAKNDNFLGVFNNVSRNQNCSNNNGNNLGGIGNMGVGNLNNNINLNLNNTANNNLNFTNQKRRRGRKSNKASENNTSTNRLSSSNIKINNITNTPINSRILPLKKSKVNVLVNSNNENDSSKKLDMSSTNTKHKSDKEYMFASPIISNITTKNHANTTGVLNNNSLINSSTNTKAPQYKSAGGGNITTMINRFSVSFKKNSKKLFECSGSTLMNSSCIKSSQKKRKRFRKNTEQLKTLVNFYNMNKTWNKNQIKAIAEQIGLKENKVYKWLWDQKNKELKSAKFIVNK